MTHAMTWPVELTKQEDGSVLVSFGDVPEALTEGATQEEAIFEAEDCLVAALGGYVGAGRATSIRHPREVGRQSHCPPSSRQRSPCTTPCSIRASATRNSRRGLVPRKARSHAWLTLNAARALVVSRRRLGSSDNA